jgi:putative hydrolase of the HAD superfamily
VSNADGRHPGEPANASGPGLAVGPRRTRTDPGPRTPDPGEARGLAVLFDWGDTVMRVFPGSRGPMAGWPQVEAVPGIRRVLRALRPRAVIGLATNAADSEPGEIRAALARVRLSASFSKVYCYRALGVRKPSPEYFAAVLADLGLPAGRVVLVGDDWQADVEGALAAGLWAVWFNLRDGEGRHGARVGTVHEMAAIPELLQGWGLLERVPAVRGGAA